MILRGFENIDIEIYSFIKHYQYSYDTLTIAIWARIPHIQRGNMKGPDYFYDKTQNPM
jgi:hypothetical protein